MTEAQVDAMQECARLMRQWTERNPRPQDKRGWPNWRRDWVVSAEYAETSRLAREVGLLDCGGGARSGFLPPSEANAGVLPSKGPDAASEGQGVAPAGEGGV